MGARSETDDESVDVPDQAVDDESVDDEVIEAELVEDATEVDTPPENVPSDESDEERLVRERDEYLGALRQLQADFENFRKRALKQQGEAIDRATGRIVEDLLPVLDACDAGLEHGDEGVKAVFAALLGALERTGLERLDPVGEPFDPNAHEAVLHEPAVEDDQAGEPEVVEVMRPGYRWKERTLRAAMVKVRG